MDVIQILKESFDLLKRKKYLLVFGLFLSILSQRASFNSGLNTSTTNTERDFERVNGSFPDSFPNTDVLITIFIIAAIIIIAFIIIAASALNSCGGELHM